MMIWKVMTITTMTIVMMTVTMSKVANLVTALEHLGKLWRRWCGRGAGRAELDKLVSQSTQASQDSLHFSSILQNWRTQLQIYFMLSKSCFPRSSFVTFNISTECNLPKHRKFQTGHFRPRWIFPRSMNCCDWYRSLCTAIEGEISEFDLFDGVLKMNTLNVSSRLKMKTTCCPAMHNFYLTLYHAQKMKRVD